MLVSYETKEDMWIQFEGIVTDYMYTIYLTDYDHDELMKFDKRKS